MPRATTPPELSGTTRRLDPSNLVTKASMLRVTLTDLSRLPPERLAKLLLEWAAQDRTLLSRLHGTIAEVASPDSTSQPVPPMPQQPALSGRAELVGETAE